MQPIQASELNRPSLLQPRINPSRELYQDHPGDNRPRANQKRSQVSG
ncbi:hypothetical protein H6G04_06315 [Calothrix membranacea FACHB-236]|nr:hypothetical protein [Calothrix membranacea FACHB-236]